MSIRHQIMSCIARDVVVIDDIIAEIGGPAKKARDNIRSACKDGLITRHRDDVTHLPAYKLTPAGKEWMKGRVNAVEHEPEPDVTDDAASSEVGDTDVADLSAAEDEPMPPADPVLLAMANRMLHERLEGVARALRESGLEWLANVTGGEDLQSHVATLAETYRMESLLDESLISQLDVLRNEIASSLGTIARLQQEVVTLNAELVGSCASKVDSFVVLASKRKPRRIMHSDKARSAAESAIRAGAQRAEVFALVPVGRAVRGAEWKNAT